MKQVSGTVLAGGASRRMGWNKAELRLMGNTLTQLCRTHSGGVTVLRHSGREEPLLGVYDCRAADAIAALIESGRYAVRTLREVVPWRCFDYFGPEEPLMNCNTRRILRL